jgi:hypothetical protein
MGILHRAQIDDVVVKRMLSVIVNPHRYRSKAAEAFSREILPEFASPGWKERALGLTAIGASTIKAASSHSAGG